jgi:hypothetical protein
MESDSCRSRSTSSGIAGGPIRWMISKITTCRSSCPGLRNRLSKGSERRAPWTRAASAVARTFGSLACRRFAQSRTRAGFLERLDSVGGSGDWDSATAWLRPAANIIARACFFMNDITGRPTAVLPAHRLIGRRHPARGTAPTRLPPQSGERRPRQRSHLREPASSVAFVLMCALAAAC